MMLQVKEQQSLWENYQKLEQKHGTDTLLQPTDKNNPADALILDF